MAIRTSNILNALPVHDGWAGREGWEEMRDQNKEVYTQLLDFCTFGKQPLDGLVVINQLSGDKYNDRYQVVSNPIGLDSAHIALFCDAGSLCFGYDVRGGIIHVHID